MGRIDQLITSFDRGLRTLTGQAKARRPSPAAALTETEDQDPASIDDRARLHSAGLMRVNHTGEVCAQALYEGQALMAGRGGVREQLYEAARDEMDHLAWCEDRLKELEARPSILNPLFYSLSFGLGAITGMLGDRISLGFVEATEDQVCQHLESHLESLPPKDARSRAIVEIMHAEEAGHGSAALHSGGTEFPKPIKQAMGVVSKIMTTATYRI